jgi:hypothetical protein
MEFDRLDLYFVSIYIYLHNHVYFTCPTTDPKWVRSPDKVELYKYSWYKNIGLNSIGPLSFFERDPPQSRPQTPLLIAHLQAGTLYYHGGKGTLV